VAAGLLLALALAVVGLELGASSLLGLVFQLVVGDGAEVGIVLHSLSYSILVAPLVAGLLVVAAALPSRIGFRLVLLLALAAVFALAMTSCATMPLVGPETESQGDLTMMVVGLVCYGPATLAALALALGAVATLPGQVRADGRAQAEDWLVGQLEQVGWVRLDAAAQALDASEAQVRGLALHLAVARYLPMRMQGAYVVHRDATAHTLAKLLATIEAEGRVRLADLADRVSAPDDLVQPWVDELAADPALPLTVDRGQGAVLWRIGASLEMSWCPRCGGPEHQVGGGVLRCASCDGERAT
jgi:hypothetical protein